MDPMGLPVEEFAEFSTRVWTWVQFWLYMGGYLLNKAWEFTKWRRDQKREGNYSAATVKGYFSRYLLIAPATLFATVGAFFAWTSGLLPFEYSPDLVFFIGFFSDGFSTHVMKMLRNMTGSLAGHAT